MWFNEQNEEKGGKRKKEKRKEPKTDAEYLKHNLAYYE